MAQWNQTDRTLQTKIVYWGPALCGKTTNLQKIHELTDPEGENRIISLNTASDRTLFFDLLPLDLGRIFGHTLKVQLYTVPGQVRYDATRRVVLSGADAVVFVADSQPGKGAENRASWENLRGNMKYNGLDPAAIPVIVQYNKQDLPGCLSPKDVEASLQSGKTGISASALTGTGVLATFHAGILEMLKRLSVPSGRRRVEDGKVLEEQIERVFAVYRGRESDAETGASSLDPGLDPAGGASPGGPGGVLPYGTRNTDAPRATSVERLPGSVDRDATNEPSPSKLHSVAVGLSSPSPTTIRFNDEIGGDDLLVRSLKATLGIAEQFGEMRDLKNRLSRRVGELEALQSLAWELAKRPDGISILRGMADAALSIPGALAATVLVRVDEQAPLSAVVLKGVESEPLLSGGGGSPAEELLKRGDPVLLEALPVVGGFISTEVGSLAAAMVVPLRAASKPPGLVLVYGEAPFAPEDLRFLGLLASHASVCLDNAAMTERLTIYSEKLEGEVKTRTSELERANQELRGLDKMKDRFLSSISHEMKTPLTGILSGAELLATIIPEEDPAHEFVTMIEHEGRRLAGLVDRILRFHVFGNSGDVEDAGAVDILDVVRGVVAEASERASAREVGIAVDLPEHLSLVEGTRDALTMALNEVLDNAIKFSPPSGLVFVEAREELVTSALGVPDPGDGEVMMEEYVVIAVRDFGPGIPQEEQARIFERFEQGGDILTSKPAGLGLGLPMAREVVRRHGGDLTVHSQPGGGSEFQMRLRPCHRTPGGGASREETMGASR